MKIIKNLEKSVWQEFLRKNKGISGIEFLLSPEWFDITKKGDSEVEVLSVVRDLDYKNKNLVLDDVLALIVIIKKPLKSDWFYYYAPRGPLLAHSLDKQKQKEVLVFLFKAIWRLNRKALFLKIEPSSLKKKALQEMFPKWSLASIFRIRRSLPVQPRRTLVLDITKDENELLANMHQKTRYNIKLAKKKGVAIEEGAISDFSFFWSLMKQTGTRDAFRIHSEAHYRNLLSSQSLEFIKLYFATYKGEKIAAAIVSFYGQKATYLHGASNNEYRKLMAPHLLQFELIKIAKAKHCESYDFYGIDAKKWPGVTRFKQGFSGQEKEYAGAYDIIFRPMYYRAYRLAKGIRKIIKK